MLAAFLKTAKAFEQEQMRADEAGTTKKIDGMRDVEELVTRNAHSAQPLPTASHPRARSGQNEGVGEVTMDYRLSPKDLGGGVVS